MIFFRFSQNNGGDAFARAALTMHWLEHPSLTLDFGGPRWLPLHFWLMALMAQIVPNVILACRLLSLVAGLASLWLFWKLVRRLYDEPSATFSLAVFVFFSLHIAYGTTSSSEETFVAFILGGLLGVFSFRASGNYAALVAGGLALSAAAAIRFEAWIVIFALGLVFLVGQRERPLLGHAYWKSLLTFGIASGVWPVFWAIRSWRLFGNPFFGLADNRASVPAQLSMYPAHGALYELALGPGVIMLTLTPIAVAGACFGLWRSLREKKSLDFAFIVVFFFLFQSSTVAAHGTIALSRYNLMLGTFCAALSGYGLSELSAKFLHSERTGVPAVLTALLAANLAVITSLSEYPSRFEDKFRSISPLMQFPVRVEEVGKALQPKMRPTDRVLIDNYNYDSNMLAITVGLPIPANDRAFLASDIDGRETDPFPYLNSKRPRFAILSKEGTIGSRLNMQQDCSPSWLVRRMDFRCIFENQVYRIYEIRYESPPGESQSNISAPLASVSP